MGIFASDLVSRTHLEIIVNPQICKTDKRHPEPGVGTCGYADLMSVKPAGPGEPSLLSQRLVESVMNTMDAPGGFFTSLTPIEFRNYLIRWFSHVNFFLIQFVFIHFHTSH